MLLAELVSFVPNATFAVFGKMATSSFGNLAIDEATAETALLTFALPHYHDAILFRGGSPFGVLLALISPQHQSKSMYLALLELSM